MNVQLAISGFCVFLSVSSSVGCSAFLRLSAEQNWSKNFVLAEGVRANDPAIIDGNLRTLGQSQYVESAGDVVLSAGSQSESVITLPEPKSIHRIVIHSSNLQAFDVWVTDSQGRWEKIKEIQSTKKKKVIDLRLNRTVYTSGIKIRVRRTSDDAAQRRKNVQNVRGWRVFSGKTNAPAKIGEIELYGFVSAAEAEIVVQEQDDKGRKGLDEFDRLMH